MGSSLYSAWRGEGSDTRLFYAKLDGRAFSPPQLIPAAASSVGPSLCACNFAGVESLYAAWKSTGSDQSLWYASFDGTNWSAQALLVSRGAAANMVPLSSVGPSLAALNGVLYAAWKGSACNQGLWFASFDGANWSPQTQIPGTASSVAPLSSVGPSLCEFGGKLYAAWKGGDGDQSVWYASFDGTSWSAQAKHYGVASSIGPALTVFGTKLYAMWKGSGNDTISGMRPSTERPGLRRQNSRGEPGRIRLRQRAA